MKPTMPLKYCSIAFAVLWAGWMLWWSGTFTPANIIILSVCGAVVGYFWYRAMRWSFRWMKLLPQNHIDPGADPGAGHSAP
ncbi:MULTISPECIES: hypothetical protein [Bradyrhizobium]|jgi:hypothetical protein|uniref:Uncharacterized protein n=2 Tax=Bradyrhizobium TaxID=374 RepID=A0ABY0Q1W0_9BRAD|nr:MULTISPECIES: hypothetical protein [Bradyrhizobium]SDJ35634.1 hypothetical protein SAMN05444163_5210 [Bradyrhizobium ottawaense]SEC65457.1 hypothetical protein SAMN05444171_1952 [Bradyrhizobium lablabi]SHK81264.1 hypothetical protein SAMN05444321_0778 [Bradyrhizobium lablabi]